MLRFATRRAPGRAFRHGQVSAGHHRRPEQPTGGFFTFYNELWDEDELGPKPVENPVDLLAKNADGTPIFTTDLTPRRSASITAVWRTLTGARCSRPGANAASNEASTDSRSTTSIEGTASANTASGDSRNIWVTATRPRSCNRSSRLTTSRHTNSQKSLHATTPTRTRRCGSKCGGTRTSSTRKPSRRSSTNTAARSNRI